MRLKIHNEGEIEISLEELKAVSSYLNLDQPAVQTLLRSVVDAVIKEVEPRVDLINLMIKLGANKIFK